MVLKTAPSVLFKGLKEAVGTPEEYFTNKSKNHFPDYDTRYAPSDRREVSLQIPTRTTPRPEETKLDRKKEFNDNSDEEVTSVKDLKQGSTTWTIKVTVQRKSEVKTWRSVVAQGELFTVDLVDADGTQILGSFLDQQVTKFFPVVEEGRTYLVRNGVIKLANKNFTPIPNRFCINFSEATEFIEVPEDVETDNSQVCFEKSLIEQQTEEHFRVQYEHPSHIEDPTELMAFG